MSAHAGVAGHPSAEADADHPFSPIPLMLVVSMALAIVGGIVLVASLPRVSLGVPATFLSLAGLSMLGAVVAVTRLADFAWHRFFQVLRWALLAYLVIVGLLAYVFVLDGTRGSTLIVLLSILAVFGADVPMLLAFSVARCERVEASRPGM